MLSASPQMIERGMLVAIRDCDEAGIWRGLSGVVSSVRGQSIRVRTAEGVSGPLTSAELSLPAQMRLEV